MDTKPPEPGDGQAADVLLTDGTVAVIRPLAPSDAQDLRDLHERLSDESYRLRFFGVARDTGHQYVEHLFRDQVLAIVLELDRRVVALATADPVRPGTAEVAFLVEDGHHGQGIGSLLLEHLAAAARARGTATFEADVLVQNHAMLDVLADAGFTYARDTAAGVVTVRLDTRLTRTSRAAADARDRRAEAHSLHPLLYPRSVVVLGVRSDGSGVGRAILDSIRDGGFTGALYVVHPKDPRIEGVPVFTRCVRLPETVDLAVIAVPAEGVIAALTDVADAGVRSAVVISSGFRELGEVGAAMQGELAELARARSVRIVGPNCLGVMSNYPDIRLNATFSGCVPPEGGLAVATQSGGVGIVLADLAQEQGLGIGSLVSLGNKADVSGNDLLAAWTDDPRVTAAALYLESFGNAPKFARIARRFAERKPLLAVVGGRSAGGQRAGASHTAAAATPAVGVAALFAQAGVIGCDDAEDLARTAKLVTREPLPRGARLGVVSNAGGMGVLAVDSAAERGLAVPELSAPTQARLGRRVSGTTGTSNPVDAGAGVEAADLAAIVEDVMTSGEVDAVLVALVATSLGDPAPALATLAEVRQRHGDVPLLVVTHGVRHPPPEVASLTVFGSCAEAVKALRRATTYSAWLRERTAETVVEADPDTGVGTAVEVLLRRRGLAQSILRQDASPQGWVGAAAAVGLLDEYGLTPLGGVASDPESVADLARQVGFPVAIKVADREVVHRAERGLVRVGLASVEDVRSAAASFAREMGRDHVPMLVQPVVSGVEIAVGLVRDPSFGPLVMVGAGGAQTDVLMDRVYMLPPVHAGDVRRSLHGLRCWPLLEGFRGSEAVDVEALVDLVVAVGRLAQEVPEVAELDANPVMVSATGCSLVDVKLRLEVSRSPEADSPRQLRPLNRGVSVSDERAPE